MVKLKPGVYVFKGLDFDWSGYKDRKPVAWNNREAKSWEQNPRYPEKPGKGMKAIARKRQEEKDRLLEQYLEEKYSSYAKVKRRGTKKQIVTVRALLK